MNSHFLNKSPLPGTCKGSPDSTSRRFVTTFFLLAFTATGSLWAALDSDSDGIPDNIENPDGLMRDTDNDGIPDYLDVDSDNDGKPDSVEGIVDADGDGAPDYIDYDSDGDADGDGIPDSLEGIDDTDNDGVPDYLDIDADNDGLTDLQETGFGWSQADSDNDGIADFKDLDSDNDGITDTNEAGGFDADQDGIVDNFTDVDGDGVDDAVASSPLIISDLDSDGSPNHIDIDADGDGTPDLLEIGGVDNNGDGRVDSWTDTDEDGIYDYADVDQTGGSDADADGIDDSMDVDFLNDIDSDGDGIADTFDFDTYEEGFVSINPGQPLLGAALPDLNGNGIPDFIDGTSTAKKKSGSGCSLLLDSNTTAVPVDPLIPILTLVSAILLIRRRATQSG